MFTLLASLAMVGDMAGSKDEKSAANEDKIVCRSVWTAGSRIPERTCRTKKEWAAIEEANSKQLQNRSNYSRGTQNRN